MWACAEMGIGVTRLDYGENFARLDTPEFRAMNPHGKIPTLGLPDGRTLWETNAILRYLAGLHADARFWPADPYARAEIDMWATWAKIEVAENFTFPIFWAAVRTPKDRHDHAAIRAAINRLEAELALAEPRLASGFLVGDALTLADIQFGHVLYRYFHMDIDRRELPNLRGYYNRLSERPAYQTHVMLNYDELRNTV